MTGMWITRTSLLLCILITWTCALPLQKTPGDQDSDEGDSDEEESSTIRPSQNATDQELSNKATQFLTTYFANHGPDGPLHIATNSNHTIVITIVPNNGSQDFENGDYNTEGPPTFGGDIPLHPFQQYQQPIVQLATLQEQPQDLNLTPIKNLVGFVSSDRLPSIIAREATETPPVETSSKSAYNHPTRATQDPTTTTSTTTTPPPVKEQPVDNIEDAILEALSIAGGEGGQGNSGSPSPAALPSSQSNPANANYQALIDSGAIPGLSSSNNNVGNNGVIKVPSNFGPVFIQTEEQSTGASSGTVFVNRNTPAPPPQPPQVATAPQVLPPNIVLLQPFLPPDESGTRRPSSSAHAIKAVSGIIGSISEGNLGSLVQNTIKLAETPVVQNTAKLATVAILHNVFQGLNPCNFLGNCGPRPQLLQQPGK